MECFVEAQFVANMYNSMRTCTVRIPDLSRLEESCCCSPHSFASSSSLDESKAGSWISGSGCFGSGWYNFNCKSLYRSKVWFNNYTITLCLNSPSFLGQFLNELLVGFLSLSATVIISRASPSTLMSSAVTSVILSWSPSFNLLIGSAATEAVSAKMDAAPTQNMTEWLALASLLLGWERRIERGSRGAREDDL